MPYGTFCLLLRKIFSITFLQSTMERRTPSPPEVMSRISNVMVTSRPSCQHKRTISREGARTFKNPNSSKAKSKYCRVLNSAKSQLSGTTGEENTADRYSTVTFHYETAPLPPWRNSIYGKRPRISLKNHASVTINQ